MRHFFCERANFAIDRYAGLLYNITRVQQSKSDNLILHSVEKSPSLVEGARLEIA